MGGIPIPDAQLRLRGRIRTIGNGFEGGGWRNGVRFTSDTRTCSRPGWRTIMVPVSPPPQQPPLSSVQKAGPPEPNAGLTQAADAAEMPLPSNPQTLFLGGLFALGILAVLYLASSIILPIVLAFVLKLLLQPAVRLLERVHLPRTIGALLAILLVIGALVGLVAALSVPAATWAERLPAGIPRLE